MATFHDRRTGKHKEIPNASSYGERDQYVHTALGNGLHEIRDRKSGLSATLNNDGTKRNGDLRRYQLPDYMK